MFKKRIELTTVAGLIDELLKLPPDAIVYASGCDGYLHIGTDSLGNDCISFDEDALNDMYEYRYEAVLGFNTKQWWAYDNMTDEFCDPPIKVLEEIALQPEEEQEDFFNKILEKLPSWLDDKEHRYDGDMDI